MEERLKMLHQIFGKPPQLEVKVKNKPRPRKVVTVSLRRSERLEAKQQKEIISCPICFRCFDEVSNDMDIHFEAHL